MQNKRKLSVHIEVTSLDKERQEELMGCSTSYGCNGSGNASNSWNQR